MLSFNFFMEKKLLKTEDLDFSVFACKKVKTLFVQLLYNQQKT